MASIQIGGYDKLQVLADLIYLARHSPAEGSELQLCCLDLAADVILGGLPATLASVHAADSRVVTVPMPHPCVLC
jgi:hypothetical protein